MHELSEKTSAEFERRLNELAGELEEIMATWDAAGPVTAEDYPVSAVTRARLAVELRRVRRALIRLSGGGFGTCSRCSLPIEKERLRADPAARYCKKCGEAGADEQNVRPDFN